jgi:glycosyltransferase involved in cell wall biosynthesis
MALGKATIVTRISGTLDYIREGETGFFVNPGDIENMKRTMSFLLENPASAERIGASAQEAVRKYFLIGSKIRRISSMIKETEIALGRGRKSSRKNNRDS